MRKDTTPDFSIRSTTFFMKCVGLWIAENDGEERLRKIAWGYTIWTTCFATVMQCRDVYYSWGDLKATLFCLCNVLCLLLVGVKVLISLIHKMEFFELILYMREHFWNCNSYDAEKKIVDQSKKTCILFTSIVTISGHGTVAGYLLTPIIANIGKNESDRIFPFNMWMPQLPLTMTPYFELCFIVQAFTFYQIAICYFSFDNILCIINVHLSGQFRILQYRLETLCHMERKTEIEDAYDNVMLNDASTSYEKLKNCIRQHQVLIDFSVKIENMFTLMILAQVIIFSALICLLGYQTILETASTAKRCGFLSSTLGSAFMLLMFTYSCHSIVSESDKVGVSAYSGLWSVMPMNQPGKALRKDLMMIMLRSEHVCCLTAFGFFPISLETYTKIMSTAVSYFTLLRQSTDSTIES
ncbi:odorant receptor 4-like [Hylaeus anthracinus]|uniref:odorant receptor 4-like n=1 Tax=Hylaeus anthracinus TaxID=313031 RepID=UPI0023B98B93|nr:odorant receptor 4-like [Hylaeus anthracinus]